MAGLTFEQFKLASNLYAKGLVQHNGGEPVSYEQHMQEYPYLGEVMVLLGITEGPLFPNHAAIDLSGLRPDELWKRLNDRLGDLNNAGNESTIRAHKLGFNDHGELHHIQPMHEDAVALAGAFGLSEQEFNELLVAIKLHDGGMNESRGHHYIISSFLVERLVPELKPDEKRRIRHMIIRHDEKVANTVVDDIVAQGVESEEQLYQKMLERFGKGALMLIILDKIQLGRIRLTPADHDYGGDVTQDAHTLATAFFERQDFTVKNSNGRSTANLSLAFRPDIFEYEEAECNHIHCEGKPKVKASNEMHRAYREYGYPHMLWWFKEFLQVYESRLGLMARTAFALKPDLEAVNISIVDRLDGSDGAAMGFNIRINRGQVGLFEEAVKLLLETTHRVYLNQDSTIDEKPSGKNDRRIKPPKQLAAVWQQMRRGDFEPNIKVPIFEGVEFWCHVPVGQEREVQELFFPKEARKKKR